jgi:hypothetical protein
MNDPNCAICHLLTDPIGFGFEHYDGMGRWRDTENGLAIDASGEVLSAGDASGTFDGAVALAKQLAQSNDVQGCMVRQWFRYGLGRAESPNDGCMLEDLERHLTHSGGSIRSLIVALVQSEAFRYRRKSP